MRKTAEIVIERVAGVENRDAGKKFLITELHAAPAEGWAMRAFGAARRSGMQVPDDVVARGMSAMATYGLGYLMAAPYPDVQPLLDEMLACVQIVEPAVTRSLTPDDIEEVSTRFRLRDEVLQLHVGFSPAGVLLQEMAAAIERVVEKSSNTPISAASSEPSSVPARRRSTSSKPSTRSKTPISS